ncbi:hypothetical protein C8R48DRAFT_764615 [Suillus tomentosus]|nr:hypothetical protein C8R48DRAFT_764615 [Suillus tomentosus]
MARDVTTLWPQLLVKQPDCTDRKKSHDDRHALEAYLGVRRYGHYRSPNGHWLIDNIFPWIWPTGSQFVPEETPHDPLGTSFERTRRAHCNLGSKSHIDKIIQFGSTKVV